MIETSCSAHDLPITTKFADFFPVDFLYSSKTSRFLLLMVTFSSTDKLLKPPARSPWDFLLLPFLDADGFDLNPA
jgi:hypothetical protein